MFYFYAKDQSYLQCEVRTTEVADTFAIEVTEADGRVRTQYISGSEAVHKRWVELQEELTGAGWWGPCGRD
ncbi:MAG: hypothetical protein V7647_3598 [Acidobacteriota bacterium]|jgi:hypothetical protein